MIYIDSGSSISSVSSFLTKLVAIFSSAKAIRSTSNNINLTFKVIINFFFPSCYWVADTLTGIEQVKV